MSITTDRSNKQSKFIADNVTKAERTAIRKDWNKTKGISWENYLYKRTLKIFLSKQGVRLNHGYAVKQAYIPKAAKAKKVVPTKSKSIKKTKKTKSNVTNLTLFD